MRLRRLFWIGAAGLLGLAALISIVALLRGEFTETDGKILGTLGAALLAGSAGRRHDGDEVAEAAQFARDASDVFVDVVRLRPGEGRDEANAQRHGLRV